MADASSLRRLAERSFDGDLAGWVTAKRAGGESWRGISAELITEHELNVSHETLRAWYGKDDPAERATA
jgi:transposase-like protein